MMLLLRPAMTPARFFRLVAIATGVLLLFLAYLWFDVPFSSILSSPLSGLNSGWITPDGEHPIDQLILGANKEFESLTSNVSLTLHEAAKRYRAKRGRHPPPGFDRWFKFAQKNDALVIESLFDQIYTDLEPFWGANASDLREFTSKWPSIITIRHHTAAVRDPIGGVTVFNTWLYVWLDMLRQLPPLPDVDLALFVGDEPRVLLDFPRITEYMKMAESQLRTHNNLPLRRFRKDFPEYPKIKGKVPEIQPEENYTLFDPSDYWDMVVKACKPGDPIFTQPHLAINSSVPPVFSTNYTAGTLEGFVSNFTISKNVCHNPNLRTLHGHMIQPHMKGIYTDLKPLFSVAKLAGVNNDILLPVPEHYKSQHHDNEKDSIAWKKKKAAAVWRGSASGGEHNKTNWWGFQRHRLIAMMNGTTISHVEKEMKESEDPNFGSLRAKKPKSFNWGRHNIAYPNQRLFNVTAQSYHKVGKWMDQVADGGFTHQYCAPYRLIGNATCWYMSPYYSVADRFNSSQIMHYKYLPDVDGQSSSGRYRAFLESLSVPIKATIFEEWRDCRLVPWRHFVPMTNEFQDWWGLMEYFVGYRASSRKEKSIRGHDSAGQRIGQLGSEWTDRVTRKVDMELYLYRLILEYARVSADDRVELGFVDDLK